MLVVILICIGYLALVIALLFFVKNEWCDLLFRNMTVSETTKFCDLFSVTGFIIHTFNFPSAFAQLLIYFLNLE